MRNLMIFLFSFSTFFSFAQKDVDVKLFLRDGNILSGKTKISSIEMQTKYGKIVVPIKDLTSVELGIPADEKNKINIVSQLKALQNADEKTAESLYKKLINMPITTIPVVDDFLFSDDYNADAYNSSYNPENVLSELKSKYNVNSDYSKDDVIYFDDDYKIGGTYNFKSLSLTTEYGNLTIPREKIEKIESQYIDPNAKDRRFKLAASKNISANATGGWLKTGITLKTGQHFSITASGEIVLASLSNEKYNPDGKVGAAPVIGTYPSYGNVVYKIGESGTTMKAGSKFSGVAETGGMLYLSIYETVYNASNTGYYSVKVALKK